jgi:hypothetical protein
MWHWRLGHAHMSWIQRIMRPRKYQDTGTIEVCPVNPVRNSKPTSCAAPMCTALLGLWFDSPLLATILATGGISIFGDSSL